MDGTAIRAKEPDLKFWEYTALFAFVFEAAGVAVYGALNNWAAASVLFLVAMAACASGSLLGFIFGVPRFKTDAVVTRGFQHNSNLEQISDWLTKILVGATLVQLDRIGAAAGAAAARIGGQMPGAVAGEAAALSVMVFSFFAGFMWGYLWISLRVRGELDLEERQDRTDPAPDGSSAGTGAGAGDHQKMS